VRLENELYKLLVSICKLPDKTEENICDFRLTRTFKLIEALPSHQALSHTEHVVLRNPKVNVKLKLRIKLRLKLFLSTLRRHVGGGRVVVPWTKATISQTS